MRRARRGMAALIALAGVLVALRGVAHALGHGLGWGQVVLPAVAGGLMVALGLARWRHWGGGPGGRPERPACGTVQGGGGGRERP